jgi:hypothetical protein
VKLSLNLLHFHSSLCQPRHSSMTLTARGRSKRELQLRRHKRAWYRDAGIGLSFVNRQRFALSKATSSFSSRMTISICSEFRVTMRMEESLLCVGNFIIIRHTRGHVVRASCHHARRGVLGTEFIRLNLFRRSKGSCAKVSGLKRHRSLGAYLAFASS